MAERSYTVSEIDRLRRAVRTRMLFGTTSPKPGNLYTSRGGPETDKAIEEQVRTHMLAGHTADDIYRADNPEYKPRE